jgi:hypothetical protein
MKSLRMKNSKRRRVLKLLSDYAWHHENELEDVRFGGFFYRKVLAGLRHIGYVFEIKPVSTPGSDALLYRLSSNPTAPVRRVRVYLTEASARSILHYLPDNVGCKEAREAARLVLNSVRTRAPSTKHKRTK